MVGGGINSIGVDWVYNFMRIDITELSWNEQYYNDVMGCCPRDEPY